MDSTSGRPAGSAPTLGEQDERERGYVAGVMRLHARAHQNSNPAQASAYAAVADVIASWAGPPGEALYALGPGPGVATDRRSPEVRRAVARARRAVETAKHAAAAGLPLGMGTEEGPRGPLELTDADPTQRRRMAEEYRTAAPHSVEELDRAAAPTTARFLGGIVLMIVAALASQGLAHAGHPVAALAAAGAALAAAVVGIGGGGVR